jgi:hypothetical protein
MSDPIGFVAANGRLVSRVAPPELDGAALAALPGDQLARRIMRQRIAQHYIEDRLDDLESDLLKLETCDALAHRIGNLRRAYSRLCEPPLPIQEKR